MGGGGRREKKEKVRKEEEGGGGRRGRRRGRRKERRGRSLPPPWADETLRDAALGPLPCPEAPAPGCQDGHCLGPFREAAGPG